MDIVINFSQKLFSIPLFESINISIHQVFLIFLLILLILFRSFFAKYLVNKIAKLLFKNSYLNNNDDKLILLSKPIKLLPILIFTILIQLMFEQNHQFYFIIKKINLSITTFILFYFLYNLIELSKDNMLLNLQFLNEGLKLWLVRIIDLLIIFFGFVAILEIWGIAIGPILGGLGLFGIAVALGAQDFFKNLISGISILIEKKFKIGDVVNIPNISDGVVEDIGFRSTTIRKFDSTPLNIPNFKLSDSSITNYSNRYYRRIEMKVALEYSTTFKQLKNIKQSIYDYIHNNSVNFYIDNNYKCLIKVIELNDSSIDILINCFTNTTDWEKYLDIKENLIFFIKDIVENKYKASFAFPSRTIYKKNI